MVLSVGRAFFSRRDPLRAFNIQGLSRASAARTGVPALPASGQENWATRRNGCCVEPKSFGVGRLWVFDWALGN
jgi:hypothetical protein